MDKKINRVLHLTSKILKILYIVSIVGIVFIATTLIKDFNILPILLKILTIIRPVIIGLIIAWLFNPIINYLQTKKFSRIIATILVYFLIVVIIFTFFYLLVPSLMNQIKELTAMLPKLINTSNNIIEDIIRELSKIKGIDFSDFSENIYSVINDFANNFITNLPKNFINFVSKLFSITGQVLISLLVGFYFSLNYEKTKINFSQITSQNKFADLKMLIKVISKKINDFLKGTLISTIILFILCFIGFLISGLNAAFLFAIFCSITNIIPYFGAFIGGVPTVIVAFSQGTSVGIAVLIIFVVIQVIYGNFLLPYVMKKTMKMDQVTMIIGLIVFGYLFGLIGMAFAVPIVATLKILIIYLFSKLKLFGLTTLNLKEELNK